MVTKQQAVHLLVTTAEQIREWMGRQTSERPLVRGGVGVEELGVHAGAVEVPCLQRI